MGFSVRLFGRLAIAAVALAWSLSAVGQGHTNTSNFQYLGNLPVGASQSFSTHFTVAKPVTLSATKPVQVFTQGVTDVDYYLGTLEKGDVPCSGTIEPATGCTVVFNVRPSLAGLRSGAVQIYFADGTPFETHFLAISGTGPQVAFDPGGSTEYNPPALHWGQTGVGPLQVAVNGSGEVYVAANEGSTRGIYKLAGPQSETPVVTGLPGGLHNIAIGGAGELYYIYAPTSPGSENLIRIDVVTETVLTGLKNVQGLAVDSAGDILIAQADGAIIRYASANDTHETLNIGKIDGLAVSDPTAIAVDGDENIYIADSGNGRIVKVPPSGAPAAILAIASDSGVYQLIVGGNGDLYIAQTVAGKGEILKLTPGGVLSTVLSGEVLGSTFVPYDLAVDGSGNLYLNSGDKTVLFVDRATEALAFGNVRAGGSGNAGDAQQFTIENIGNETLDFNVTGSAASAMRPEIAGKPHNGYTLPAGYVLVPLPPFVVDPVSPCPVTYVANAIKPNYSLAADADCGLAVAFEPTNGGADNGTMAILDNALNVSGAQQWVSLTGDGANQSATITLSPCQQADTQVDCSAMFDDAPIALTATTVPAGLAVTITYQNQAGGVATTTPPFLPGVYSVVATVTAPGFAGSLDATLTIAKAMPTVTWTTPPPIADGAPITAAQLDATGSVPGLITFAYAENYGNIPLPKIGNVLPVGSYKVIATLQPSDSTEYAFATAEQTLVVDGPIWSPYPLAFGEVLQLAAIPGPSLTSAFTNETASPVDCTQVTFTSGGTTIPSGSLQASTGLKQYPPVYASPGASTTHLLPGQTCTYSFAYDPPILAPPADEKLAVTMTITGVANQLSITGQGDLPPISLTPATVQFGTVANPIVQGQTDKQTITLTNNTSGPLTGLAGAFEVASPYFTLATPTGTACTSTLVLQAGATCQYAVQFAPTSANGNDPYSTNWLQVTLPFKWNDYQGSQTSFTATSQLNGVNASPAMAVLTASPSTAGTAIIQEAAGGHSSEATITLTNSGGVPLTGIVWSNTKNLLTGPDANSFIFDALGPLCSADATDTAPSSLPGGGSCNLDYVFAPATTAPGVYTATLSLTTALSTTPISINLTGVIYPVPTLTWPSAGCPFSNIPLHTSSQPCVATLTNTTTAPLTLANTQEGPTGCTVATPAVVPGSCAAAAIASAKDYKVTTTCPAAVAASGTCTFTVVFTPTSADDGEYIPAFETVANYSVPAPVGAQSITFQETLPGTAEPLPVIVVTPSSGAPNSGVLAFGQQTVGTVSNPQTGTLADTQINSLLTLGAPYLSGPGAKDYQVAVTCNEAGFTPAGAGTLKGGNGGACSYAVIFAPLAGGPANAGATMTIAASSPSGMIGNVTFALSGTALAPYAGRVVWIPDFEGSVLNVEEANGATTNAIKVQLPNTTANTCNPTSVTASLAYAFVFCSSAAGGKDELLVYDANIIRDATGPIDPAPLETYLNEVGTFVGTQPANGALDAEGNLWYTALSGTTGTAGPVVLELPVSVIGDGVLKPSFGNATQQISLTGYSFGHDYIQPNGLTFAPDGSLWISGSDYSSVDYGGTGPVKGSIYSILINIPVSQLTSYDPTSYSCVSSNPNLTQGSSPVTVKCTAAPEGFIDPGGVAVFDNMLWVSVTGASQFGVTTAKPGRELIGFPLTLSTNPNTPDTLGTPVTFGSATSPAESPFVCPGGLFAQASSAAHLWINDEGYGDNNSTCGGAGDVAPETGGVFDYTATQLANHTAVLPGYTNVTGSPGPGGIFVENDQ